MIVRNVVEQNLNFLSIINIIEIHLRLASIGLGTFLMFFHGSFIPEMLFYRSANPANVKIISKLLNAGVNPNEIPEVDGDGCGKTR